ncbi:MAG TPA: glycosyltransferase [Candidatus Saccharimonadales bacterium]|jgi:glycosyltransferase involved in cell wall biosynthesis|nr:glycosyltransferase [Candidatus Saccharimonadales bacterium]
MAQVLVFPRDLNPYQNRLHGALPGDITTRYIDVLPDSRLKALFFAPRLLAALLAGRMQGFRIFHLHWLYPFSLPKIVPGHQYLSMLQTLFFIRIVRLLGYRLVWTVHNVLPHEQQTSDDRRVARYLAASAAVKIVHSTASVTQMEAAGLDTNNLQIIPHGNYIGVYPEHLTSDAARAQLGLQPADRVILFFGIIRPHKGVEQLLTAFGEQKLPHARLVIAGACNDPALRKTLTAAKKDARIIVHDHHISDDDVALYYRACDVVCLPFQAVTTSGSALLALSFGKPLIAPRAGALLDIPAAAGILYNPETDASLAKIIRNALSNPQALAAAGKAAGAYAATLGQPVIAGKTAEIYRTLSAK